MRAAAIHSALLIVIEIKRVCEVSITPKINNTKVPPT